MKKYFFLIILFSTIMSSCDKDILNRPSCNNKFILKYTSLTDLQNEYNHLRTDYDGTTDEQVLISFENQNLFYSLRKKDAEMDDGIIADDPNFDLWDYSSDNVTCTLLNEDGMIIIANDLYAWSDGCIGFKAPFDCNNYQGLLNMVNDFSNGTISDADYQNYLTSYQIEIVDLCTDEFDLESNYDGHSQEGSPERSNCDLDTYIGVKILSNDPINKIAEVELTAYNLGVSNDIKNTWYIDNVGNEVTIIGGSNPIPINQLWNQAGGFYVGSFLRIQVDYNIINFLDLRLGAIYTDRTCKPAYDYRNLDLVCPILLNAEPLNPNSGQWKFTIEGLPVGSVGLFDWNFNDGPIITNGNFSMLHNFPVPCAGGKTYTVTIDDLEGNMPCNFPLTKQIYVSNPCTTNSFRDKYPKKGEGPVKADGRKVRIVHKIKRNGKIKSKFKLRKKGKVIDVLSGTILKKVNDDICTPVSLESLMASRSVSPCGHDGDPATHNKKRKLKQRYKSQDRFYLDKNNPYTIRFSYPNAGYNYDYIPNKPCMSRQ